MWLKDRSSSRINQRYRGIYCINADNPENLLRFLQGDQKKKGKMVIRINQKMFDLEAYNIEELKMKIELESGQPTKTEDE